METHHQVLLLGGGGFLGQTFSRTLLRNCDTLIHLAGATTPSTSATSPIMEAEANIGPTLCLLELAQKSELWHLIFRTIYGNPMLAHLCEK